MGSRSTGTVTLLLCVAGVSFFDHGRRGRRPYQLHLPRPDVEVADGIDGQGHHHLADGGVAGVRDDSEESGGRRVLRRDGAIDFARAGD